MPAKPWRKPWRGSAARPGSAASTCSQILSTDVIYTDIWTTGVTPAGRRRRRQLISYLYADLPTRPTPPTNANCAPWTAQCRITIHLPQRSRRLKLPSATHLESVARATATVDGVANTSVTCTTCHNPVSARNAVQVPAGQLDLTGGAPASTPTVVTSYEELLFPHDEQTLNMGVLQDLLVPAPDPGPGCRRRSWCRYRWRRR